MSGVINPASFHLLRMQILFESQGNAISSVTRIHWGFSHHNMKPYHAKVLPVPLVNDTNTQLSEVQRPGGRYTQYLASVVVLLLNTLPVLWVLTLPSPAHCASISESNKYTALHFLLPLTTRGFTQRTMQVLSLVKGKCLSAQAPETPLRKRLWLTSSFNAGIWWRRLSPVPTGIFHVRSVRSKVLQIWICADHSKFPADQSAFVYLREVSQLKF